MNRDAVRPGALGGKASRYWLWLVAPPRLAKRSNVVNVYS
jgi:hypothetical protein